MSVKVMARVWAHSQQKGGELLVMLALADFANDAGESWPSIPTLAQKARLSDRQTRRVLRLLETAGEIKQLIRSNGGRNSRNRYLVTVSENPDKITLSKYQGKNNPVICGIETLSPMSGAINRHRTVISGARTNRARSDDADPRVRTVLTAFCEKYQSRVGSPYVVTKGKDAALLKGILSAGHDVPAVEAAMARYFADDFHSKTGFDVGRFKRAFPALISAGARKVHNFEDGAFPTL